MLAECRKHLGMGEPNFIQDWYRKRNGSAYGGNFPWCDAFLSYCAYVSGNHKAVCPKGDRAYTVYHAQDFQRLNAWFPGTEENLRRAKPGDIVFFDWGGTNTVGAIDHVGIVERVSGSTLYTIEGNISDRCMRKVRTASSVAGFGRPAYGGEAPDPHWKFGDHRIPTGKPLLKKGSMGETVKWLQESLNYTLATGLDEDGNYGDNTADAVGKLQRASKLEDDKQYGEQSAAALKKLAEGKTAVTTPNPPTSPAPSPPPAAPKEWQPSGALLEFVKAVWNVDGLIDAPRDTDTAKNPHWAPQSYLWWTYHHLRDTQRRVTAMEDDLERIEGKLDKILQLLESRVDPSA